MRSRPTPAPPHLAHALRDSPPLSFRICPAAPESLTSCRARAAGGSAGRAGDDEDEGEGEDAAATGELDPAFAPINSIPGPARLWFTKVVDNMALNPYEKWDSLWAHPPDGTCTSDFCVHDFAALPCLFYSPQLKFQSKGVCTPCARHGWEHATSVKVYSRWFPRLVKGAFEDHLLGGQLCRCITCAAENRQLSDELKRARQAGAASSIIDNLSARRKAASFNFMTYDSRVVSYYAERKSTIWVAQQLPVFLTARAAITRDLLWVIVRGQRTAQGAHHLESMLKEFRSLRASVQQLTFYSFQHACANHGLAAQRAAWSVKHLPPGISQARATGSVGRGRVGTPSE